MGKAIVVTSGKGGVGKSTLACVLGSALRGAGRRICLVDMDMGLRSLDLMLGTQDKVVYDIADVADGVCGLKQALVRLDGEGLCLLNAAQFRDGGAIAPERVEKMLASLKERFDEVLIDCPSGIGQGFRNAVVGADSAIVVMTPDDVSFRDAERVASLLKQEGVGAQSLVVNRFPGGKIPRERFMPERIAQELGIPLLGWIPEDPLIGEGEAGEGAAARAHLRVARRLMGEPVPISEPRPESYGRRLLRAVAGK